TKPESTWLNRGDRRSIPAVCPQVPGARIRARRLRLPQGRTDEPLRNGREMGGKWEGICHLLRTCPLGKRRPERGAACSFSSPVNPLEFPETTAAQPFPA